MSKKIVPQPTCSAEHCPRPANCRNLCTKHYYRFRHAGLLPRVHNFGTGQTCEDKFWSRVNKNGPTMPHMTTPCWEWEASHCSEGRGNVVYKGKTQLIHRMAWFFTYGQWPEPCCLHSCDNRRCCNPNHLREGTRQDNVQDSIDRGRHTKGEISGLSKLTDVKVRIIRQRLARGVEGRTIAKDMNVTPSTISCVKLGKSWKHVK